MTEPLRVRANNSQTDHLISYMARNPQFAQGGMGLQAHNAQWKTLAQELAEIGPAKTVHQWKTSWRDLKCRAKAQTLNDLKKNARNEKLNKLKAKGSSAKGNAENNPIVSENAKKSLDSIEHDSSTEIEFVPAGESTIIGSLSNIASLMAEQNELLREQNQLMAEANAIAKRNSSRRASESE